jgi:Autographiviridae endonuclease VII
MSHGMFDTCTRCHETFPISEFVRDAKRTRGYRRTCKACHVQEQHEYTENNRDAINERARKRHAERPKTPKPRRPALPIDEVRRRGREYQRLKRMALRGLTPDEYQAMAERQGHECAICMTPCPSGRDLCIDHDHLTGAVRGLLCLKCNFALGQFHDNITILERAIDYLRRTTPNA